MVTLAEKKKSEQWVSSLIQISSLKMCSRLTAHAVCHSQNQLQHLSNRPRLYMIGYFFFTQNHMLDKAITHNTLHMSKTITCGLSWFRNSDKHNKRLLPKCKMYFKVKLYLTLS